MVFSESDEESMTNPKMSQFHFVPIYPFKPRVRHFFCRALQSYNSPGDWARELFKPSTDLACLLVEIEKKFFALDWGFLEVTLQ